MPAPPSPPSRPDKDVQSYFRGIVHDYQESVEREAVADVQERTKRLLEPFMRGRVLDIGSGGVSDFSSDGSRTVISLDNVVEFLKSAKTPGVLHVGGDIRALPLKPGSVDRIIIQQVIHHLTSDLLGENLRNVRAAVREAARVLAPGGRVFVIDSMMPLSLDLVQRSVYSISYRALKAIGKPMVFFLSPFALARMFRASGLDPDIVVNIGWGKMDEASRALFPWLRFPLKYTPVRLRLVAGVKA